MTEAIELTLFLSSIAAFVAAVLVAKQKSGWRRFAWVLISVAWGWVALGEVLLNVLGYDALIYRWARALPARVIMATGFWILVVVGRIRNGRNGIYYRKL